MGGGGEAGREAKSARTSLPPMRNPGNKAGSARARDSGIGDCPIVFTSLVQASPYYI